MVLLRVLLVVQPAVLEDQPDVLEHLVVARVLHAVDAGADRAEVHGPPDDLVVVGCVRLGDLEGKVLLLRFEGKR